MKKTYWAAAILLLITMFIVGYLLVSNNSKQTATNSTSSQSTSSTKPSQQTIKSYSVQDVAAHKTKSDCWTIINKKVYNITPEIEQHPGGNEILRACGTDATTLFEQRTTEDGQKVGTGTPHSNNAKSQLEAYYIGNLQ